jgi:hypothetical protein
VRNAERIRERYLKDPLPIRLAGLASTLSKVASSTRREISDYHDPHRY